MQLLCPICGKEIRAQSVDQIVDRILALPEGTRFQVLSPAVKGKKGLHEKVFDEARENGFVRVKVDGYVYDLENLPELDKNKKHDIEIVVDRLVIKDGIQSRMTDSIETVMNLSEGMLIVDVIGGEEILFSHNSLR